MLEIEALVEDWRSTSQTRLVMDADQVARDPRLALVGCDLGARSGLRLLPRGSALPITPEQRFAELYRRTRGNVEVTPTRIEEAAFARVHQADLLLAGQALEAAMGQHKRIRDITPKTRAQLMEEVLVRLGEAADGLMRAGAAEGRSRKGMEWEMERVRAFLSPEVLVGMADGILKRKWDDGTRMFMEGLGTVGVLVPSLGGLSRSMLALTSSFMTGNFTFLVAPCDVPATTMMAARIADGVFRERGVRALSAIVPNDMANLREILSESPRVDGLIMFEEGKGALEASSRATALGKAVVAAWETTDVAIVWDGVDVASPAQEIVASRFTDAGQLPSSIGRVLVHPDARNKLLTAMETEINTLRVGLPSDPSTDIGPVHSLVALEHLCEVVAEAQELGAHVVHGGQRINWKSEADPVGMYFQPTLIERCDAGMRIMNERLVGPLLPVCDVSDPAEARKMACIPRRPGRVWIWATSRADRDRLVDGLRAPGIIFFGNRPGGTVKAMDLSDAWGTLELAERLSFKSWRGPVCQ